MAQSDGVSVSAEDQRFWENNAAKTNAVKSALGILGGEIVETVALGPPSPDFATAKKALDLIDEGGEFCFRRLWTDTTKPAPGTPGNDAYGTVEKCWPWIAENNRNGWCIFFCPQEASLSGGSVKDADVFRIRAVFTDNDGGAAFRDGPIPPAMVIHSGRGDHHYWLVEDGEPRTFPTIQRTLLTYHGTDPSVTNPSRIMRLPGSVWWKQHGGKPPTLVGLSVKHDRHTTFNDIIESYPQPPEEKVTGSQRRRVVESWRAPPEIIKQGDSGGRSNAVCELAGLLIGKRLPVEMVLWLLDAVRLQYMEHPDDDVYERADLERDVFGIAKKDDENDRRN